MSERKSHRKVLIISGIVAAVMFAFVFAIVPFYSILCKSTGISTSIADELVTKANVKTGADAEDGREVLVQFTATNHMGMPWEFWPKTKSVKVKVGRTNRVVFWAKNTTDRDMTVQAIPSMTPVDAISHFHKIECFCFTQQSMGAHKGRDMPLVFNIDKDLPKDIRVITLAYTLFDVTPKSPRKKT